MTSRVTAPARLRDGEGQALVGTVNTVSVVHEGDLFAMMGTQSRGKQG